eukprot:5992687-Pyramimonas_sp.AAC.1
MSSTTTFLRTVASLSSAFRSTRPDVTTTRTLFASTSPVTSNDMCTAPVSSFWNWSTMLAQSMGALNN